MPNSLATHVVRFTLVGTLFGQETINTFFYEVEDDGEDIEGEIAAFVDEVVPPIQNVASNAWGVLRVDGEYVKGGTRFGSQEINQSGNISGDCLPSFNAFDFTLLRGGVGERNGYKRIAGVPESSQTNGVATSGALVNLALLSAAMFASLTVDAATLIPVIERSVINHVPQVPPQYFTISSVVYSKIGSQNSRKVGHGR